MAHMSTPDVELWGCVVKAGKPSRISVANEDGLTELFHLTNVALDDLKSTQPCRVTVRAPASTQDFLIGTLLPGKLLQFQTDLLLQADTEFRHTGAGDVHLSGYKCALRGGALLPRAAHHAGRGARPRRAQLSPGSSH